MCAWIFSTTSVWNISHSKKKWVRGNKKIYTGLHVENPLFLSDFHETWIFSTDFRKILKYKITWKSIQCGSGQTDMMLIVAFRNFANAPKNQGTETGLWAAYLQPLA
jgi:hypothetical protein